MAIKLEDWKPQEPWQGPPLPEFLNIYWPWYAIEEEIPPVEEVIDFDLGLPIVAPQEIYPGTAITITCPVTSRCTSKQNIIVKCIIYEGSILPTHGTKITQKSSTTFSILPDETYNVTIYHTAIEGTIDRRDVEVEVYVGAKLVKQSEWDDVYYVVRPPEVPKTATITSIELDKTTVRQGENITVHAHIQSNFAGKVWIVTAYGQGTPSPGASLRPLNSAGGDYLGWFPSGFDFVRWDSYTTNVDVTGMGLKVGDNPVSHTFRLPRDLPLGEYTIYVGVVPPAANWYQWDEPYDWAVSQPFTVLEEGPLLTEVEPMVSQHLFCYRGSLALDTDIGAFSKKRNWRCSNESSWFNERTMQERYDRYWEWCALQDYYMEFGSPGAEGGAEYEGCYAFRYRDLNIGVFVKSTPPTSPYGIPTKTYTLEITGWLTYPDGHTEEISMTDVTPKAELNWRKENFHIVPFGTGPQGQFEKLMPKGKYAIRLKLVCEGITFCDETRSFTIE